MSPKLIDLPIDQARLLKWKQGREKYGSTFVGHPLAEAYEEMIDALNYLDEALRQGMIGSSAIHREVRRIAESIQLEYQKRKKLENRERMVAAG